MYCKNVRNYTIKMHVFDYLMAVNFVCVEHHAYSPEQHAILNVTYTARKLQRLALLSISLVCVSPFS